MHMLCGALLGLLAMAAVATAQQQPLDAVQIVRQIAPAAAAACPESNGECRTAEQAAPWIARALLQHGVYSAGEMAAVIAHMAFESADFRYKHNVNPGRPGQGTANMQLARYNLLYARHFDALRDQVANISSVDGQADGVLNHILSLVQPDEYNFGSGPWFLTTQCGRDVRARLRADVDDGFGAFLRCVGVPLTEARRAYFERAKKAFRLA
ncbi:uncharacterized protein UV8b_06471 [Ustilaginoidea virens]|uniref:Uncharacterized protein n=1 Tax=Ustilaginoidea virens TaxID=1159556 RepID=A0A063C927_USTVR|nr:uncharacterized protein UV8b_06471 [Ustilaginoidea virens]QUC22230.1 hypothetical protein UV8b_06471 [Ustilaginoidea virens]GAO14073.1 hypothetical protein UVI_02038350 [Ustilaginoidea virens]